MPILCKIHRGDFIESIHVAYAVAVNEAVKFYKVAVTLIILLASVQRLNLSKPPQQ